MLTASRLTKTLGAAGLLGLLVMCAACGRDVRMAGKALKDVRVRAVEHGGIRLDENATPQQVAAVLLTAMLADVRAADASRREQAVDVQLDLCAASAIAAGRPAVYSRPEWLFRIVSSWSPAIVQYQRSVEAALGEAESKMQVVRRGSATKTGDEVCDVRLALDDPDDARAGVVLRIRMVHVAPEEGEAKAGVMFWRAYSLSFEPGTRSLTGTQPAQG